jgi:hypothetical protein
LIETVIFEFHGFAMIRKCQERKEVFVMLKPGRRPPAKHPLYGRKITTKPEMVDANCMAVFPQDQRQKPEERPLELAIKDDIKDRNYCY